MTMVCAGLALAVPHARAAAPPEPDPESDAPTVRVGEVTVTATRAEREVLDVPGNVTVIDREEIERSGVRTVPELLRRQAGLFLTATTTNPAGVQVEARGFNNGGSLGSSLLVQVNGRRVNEADTANTDWASIALDDIDRIEILRGPASALYGDNAVGGVINIRTRPEAGPPRATLRGRLGSHDTGQGNLRAAGTWGRFTGGLFVDGLVTNAYRHGADFDSQDVSASLQADLGERVVLGMSGGRYADNRDFPGFLTKQEIRDHGRDARSPRSTFDGSEVDQRHLHAWLEALLADSVELELRPFARWREDHSTLSFGAGIGSSFGERDKLSVGFDAQIRVDRPLLGRDNRLIVGFDFLHEETDRTDEFVDDDPNFDFDSLLESHNSKDVYAVFVQNEIFLSERLLLSTGIRFDRAVYDLFVEDADRPPPAADDPAFSIWSPRAGLTFRIAPGVSTYVSYARGFRLPNFDEDSPVLAFFPGDDPVVPDLDPQISDSFEIGAKLERERVDAFLSLYHMKVRDEIFLRPIGFVGENDNFDRVRHRGIETGVAVQVLPWLSLHANYTLADVKVVDDDGSPFEDRRMPVTPLHRGTLGMFVALPFDVEFTGTARFADQWIVANDLLRSARTRSSRTSRSARLAPTWSASIPRPCAPGRQPSS
jgi:outer membrane receptor protein involved in Fe transport